MDKNRALHELLGLCWHEWTDDPRLVLREMMKRDDWDNFSEFVLIAHTGLCVTSMVVDSSVQLVLFPLYYISDTTGKLRDMAIEWLKENTS